MGTFSNHAIAYALLGGAYWWFGLVGFAFVVVAAGGFHVGYRYGRGRWLDP